MTVPSDDIADPARIPPRSLALVAGLILILVVLGYAIWRSVLIGGDATPVEAAARPALVKKQLPPPAPPAAVNGPVTLTVREVVWMRITDGEDKVLFAGEKSPGDSFTVPADAKAPMLRSMRADSIDAAIGTEAAQPISPDEEAVKDFPIDAASIRARAKTREAAARDAAVSARDNPDAGTPSQP